MKKLFAILLIVALVAAMFAIPASAETTGNALTASDEVVTVTKELTLTKYEADKTEIPNLTFTFDLTIPTTGLPVEGNDSTLPVYAGLTGSTLASPYTVSFATGNISGTAGNEKTFDIDFSGVDFPRPGIYRYALKERANTNSAVFASEGAATPTSPITYDDADYFLDVYVEKVETTDNTVDPPVTTSDYKVTNAVLYLQSSTNNTITRDDEHDQSVYADVNKVDRIVNDYDNYDLKLTKTVSGAAADMAKKFEFTIEFENGPIGTTLNGQTTIDGTAADITVTFDADGKATYTVNLGHEDSIEFWSLPEGTTYTITETLSDLDDATYVTTFDGTEANSTTGDMAADKEIACVNDAPALTPTGLFLSYGPYVLIVAAAVALAVIFLKKRNHADEF